MKIINLTANPIVLHTGSGDITLPVSGTVAEVASIPGTLHDTALPVPVADPPTLGEVTGIPASVPGTVYVVSGLVLAATSRADVFGPGTGPKDAPIRDGSGRIIAVTRLIAARPVVTRGTLVGNI